ncbi:MAG TPA: hypothetical protein DCP54_11995 [Chryseobacterium sp.]|nr:hypothetical protein [Chryseobacterium sp.]
MIFIGVGLRTNTQIYTQLLEYAKIINDILLYPQNILTTINQHFDTLISPIKVREKEPPTPQKHSSNEECFLFS